MSLNTALGNALSGLGANARRAEIVSANLANALTEGYGRRTLDMSSQDLGGQGAGVQVDGTARLVDRAVLADRRGAEARMTGRDALASGLRALEASFGSVDGGTDVAARLRALDGALVLAGTEPASEARLATVLSRLHDVAGALRGSSDAVRAGRESADAAIAREVGEVNAALRGIEALNADVVRARAGGRDAAALLDQRQVLVDRVAARIPVREVEGRGGVVALFTTDGTTLLDGRAAVIGFRATPVITAEMTLASGGLDGLTVNGLAVGAPGLLGGGSLGAAFALRDEVLPEAQAGLDALARDLVERFADPTTDPTLAAGAAGLLTDAGGPLVAGAPAGLAGRIAVSDLVDPEGGGALWRLRDGLGAVAPGPVGDGAQLDRWRAALDAPRALVAGGPTGSAAALAAGFASGAAARRLGAEEEASFATARWSALREAELAGGVDSDAEMQTLLAVEQAYAANARVVEAVDAMMRRILEI